TGADHYFLKVVDNNTAMVSVGVVNITGTSYAPTAAQALTPGHSFTTFVYAYSTNNKAFTIANTSFSLAAFSSPTGLAPSGAVPASAGYDRPTFTWNAVTGADHYFLKVIDNNTGAVSLGVVNITGTAYTAAAAQALTPGHSFTTYVYAYSTNNKASK